MKKNLGNLIFLLLYLFSFSTLFGAELTPTSLLDKENSFPITAFEWDYLKSFIVGVLLFLAGFFTAQFSLFEKIKEKLSTK